MKELAIRLHKGDDLKRSICELCLDKTGIVLSAVGCLSNLKIRLAGGEDYFEKQADYEIVSLTGTISNGKAHIHGSFSDKDGKVIGGHLCEGSIVNTTCELVIGVLDAYDSNRTYDDKTGYNEIVFRRK